MPRRTLTTDTSFDDINNYIMRVEVALQLAGDDGDKDIAKLAAPVSKLLGKWEALDKTRRTQQQEIIRADALVALRDVKLDAVTTALHNAVLSASNLNRKAPLFKLLFPKPLSQAVAPALETQLSTSRTLHSKLSDPQVPSALRKEHEKPLMAAITAGEAAIKKREATRAASSQLTSKVAALRDEINATLLATEGQLKTLAGKRGTGSSWVNAFFPAAARAKSTKNTPAPAPPPAP